MPSEIIPKNNVEVIYQETLRHPYPRTVAIQLSIFENKMMICTRTGLSWFQINKNTKNKIFQKQHSSQGKRPE